MLLEIARHLTFNPLFGRVNVRPLGKSSNWLSTTDSITQKLEGFVRLVCVAIMLPLTRFGTSTLVLPRKLVGQVIIKHVNK